MPLLILAVTMRCEMFNQRFHLVKARQSQGKTSGPGGLPLGGSGGRAARTGEAFRATGKHHIGGGTGRRTRNLARIAGLQRLTAIGRSRQFPLPGVGRASNMTPLLVSRGTPCKPGAVALL